MDEPLGALDRQLREQMQLEIKHLQKRLGITAVYVTHDQQEALTMSDRIAVFHEGRIRQLGTPDELYERPVNAFVAQFVGENNRLEGVVSRLAGSRCWVRLGDGTEVVAETAETIPTGPGWCSRCGRSASPSTRPARRAIPTGFRRWWKRSSTTGTTRGPGFALPESPASS